MEKLGTNYGGWSIPKDIALNNESVVYSAGVGEDMSFDILLNDKYKSNIYLFDPTEKAIKHFNEFVKYYDNKVPFTGNIQNDYYDKIKNCHPTLNQFTYIDQGLWNCETELKFYKQTNPNHVSQSLIENMFGTGYDIVKVNTIKNFMIKYNHNHIDLLKMDIEGAEIDVLENMLDDNIHPSCLCIEFDLKLKDKDHDNRTSRVIERLENCGYIILENDNYNVTLKYNN